MIFGQMRMKIWTRGQAIAYRSRLDGLTSQRGVHVTSRAARLCESVGGLVVGIVIAVVGGLAARHIPEPRIVRRRVRCVACRAFHLLGRDGGFHQGRLGMTRRNDFLYMALQLRIEHVTHVLKRNSSASGAPDSTDSSDPG